MSDRVSQIVSVRTQGSTRDKKLGTMGCRVLVRMACRVLVLALKGTSLNWFTPTKGVFVVDRVTVDFVERADKWRVLRQPSRDDRLVLTFQRGEH